MRGSICGALVLIVAAGWTLPVLGQTEGNQTANGKAAPNNSPQHYTAEFKTTEVRTLADGTTITTESTSVMAADSKGRSIVSDTGLTTSGGQKPTTWVSVTDPVAGTQASWTSPGTRATVTQMHAHRSDQSDCFVFFVTPANSTLEAPKETETAEPARGVVGKLVGAMVKDPSNPGWKRIMQEKSNTVVEDLGSATIQGIPARGERITRTTPTGVDGNDRPLVNTEEIWRSTGSNPKSLRLRRVSEDPQFGKSTTELMNLSLDEPDLSTFQPPEGYEIVTQEMHSAPCPNALKTPAQ